MNTTSPRFLLCLATIGLLIATGATAQVLFYQDVTRVPITANSSVFYVAMVGPLPNFPSPATTGLAEVDVVNTSQPEVLFHDGITITWLDLSTFASGTLTPPAPAPIVGLAGIQVVGSARRELVMMSNPAAGSELYILDLAAATPVWSGPFALGFTATAMTAADVVGTVADDLVFSAGNVFAAIDLTNPTVLVPLPSPPQLPDSIHALDVVTMTLGPPPPPPPFSTRHLSVNATGPAGPQSFIYERSTGAWNPAAIPTRFRVASAAPSDLDGVAPLTGALRLTQSQTLPLAFADVAPAAGVFGVTANPAGDGHCPGAVFTDLDGDLNADLYLPRGDVPNPPNPPTPQANQLFYGNGAGGFTQQTTLGALDTGNSSGALAFDYDNDGLQDLYVLNMGGDNRLYRQFPNGSFRDVTASTDPTPLDPVGDVQEGLRVGIPDLAGGGHCPPNQTQCLLYDTLAAAAGDFNRDGLMDVYVGNHLCCSAAFTEGERDILYLQQPGGTFVDMTFAAQITTPSAMHSSTQAVIVADFNNDQWPDIYVANKTQGPPDDKLYLNDGGTGGAWSGTFTEWFGAQPVLGKVSAAAMGIDVGDYDNDGDLDIFISDLDLSMDFYRNTNGAAGPFGLQLVSPNPMASPFWSWGVNWTDFDNDGDVDLHMSTNPTLMDWLWRNDGNNVWADVAFDAGVGLVTDTRANIPADFDADGRMDMLVVDRGTPITLLQNQSTTGNGYLRVRLIGDPNQTVPPASYKSTVNAAGARVDVTAGGVTQRRDVSAGGITCGSTRDYVLHFGLGTNAVASQVVVSWPSGRTTTLPNVAANRLITVNE